MTAAGPKSNGCGGDCTDAFNVCTGTDACVNNVCTACQVSCCESWQTAIHTLEVRAKQPCRARRQRHTLQIAAMSLFSMARSWLQYRCLNVAHPGLWPPCASAIASHAAQCFREGGGVGHVLLLLLTGFTKYRNSSRHGVAAPAILFLCRCSRARMEWLLRLDLRQLGTVFGDAAVPLSA